MLPDQTLPDPLPAEPMSLLSEWFRDAMQRRDQPNPDAMVLATVDGNRPSARVVLCKQIDADTGSLRFVTNYDSRKGHELAANPHAALVFFWDHLRRQVRLEGTVIRASAADSDSYFATRARDSQIGAHASQQSAPIDAMGTLRKRAEAVRNQYQGATVPRPDNWGSYIFRAESVELWVSGDARLHERARWSRELSSACGTLPLAGPWTVTRLQP